MLKTAALIGILALASLAPTLQADSTAASAAHSPESFIKDLVITAIQKLTHPQTPLEQREADMGKFIKREVDAPAIGRFVLGRNWRIATPEQRKAYLNLFQQYLVKSYTSKFEGYTDTELTVQGTKQKAENEYVVSTLLRLPNSSELKMDWRVFETPQGYKILDIILDNVSMSVTQRDEFYALFSQVGGDMDEFLKALQRKVESNS